MRRESAWWNQCSGRSSKPAGFANSCYRKSSAFECLAHYFSDRLLEELGCLHPCRYLLHDRDTKFCESFREVLKAGGVKPMKLPVRSPNLNAFAERWVRSVKEECLSRLILFGESSLRRALQQYMEHYHGERN